MRRITKVTASALALLFGAGDLPTAGLGMGAVFFNPVTEAQARVGRPATPGSIAGVARRTTRRVVRRGAYVGAIPAGCQRGNYYGYSLYSCGGVYYQRSGNGYVVVYF